MKRIFFISLSVLALASCQKNMTNLNVDPKYPLQVPSNTLLTEAELNAASTISSSNVNLNIFRLIQQYWTETTYTDESNYNLASRSIPDNWWNAWYRDVLNNLHQARQFARTDITVPDANVLKNDTTIIDIQEVYAYYVLVTTFGNIPYTQAMDPSNVFPKFDDAKTVYADLLKRLDADIAALATGSDSWGSADVIYNGDVSAWKKFAYSLEVKLAAVIADDDLTTAKRVMEAAAPNAFTSNDDNASFPFVTAPPNTNPVWVDLVQSGRHDFVAASTSINMLDSLNDPRMSLFFTTDGDGNYTGGDPGVGATYSVYSHPAVKLTKPDYPGLLLDYAEVEFALAEGVERGFNVGGTAAQHYNNAVTASIEFWGGTPAQAAAYLAQPSVAYATAGTGGGWREKIGTQLYLALYNRGYDSWTAGRRLGYPQLVAPPDALSVFPVRLLYPVKEENVNTSNYSAAAAAIGGDKVATKLWFDKN